MLDGPRTDIPDALHAKHVVLLIRDKQGRAPLAYHRPALPAQADNGCMLPEFHCGHEELASLVVSEQPGLRDVNRPKFIFKAGWTAVSWLMLKSCGFLWVDIWLRGHDLLR